MTNFNKTDLAIVIRPLADSDPVPYGLLLLADPSREAVDDYLRRGSCYGAFLFGKVVGICVVLPTRPFTMELVNLAVDETLWGRGVARRIVAYAVQAAREAGCRTFEVATANAGIGQLALYQKCGFEIDSVDKDYFRRFRRFYPEKIVENGIECKHMIRLKMDL